MSVQDDIFDVRGIIPWVLLGWFLFLSVNALVIKLDNICEAMPECVVEVEK